MLRIVTTEEDVPVLSKIDGDAAVKIIKRQHGLKTKPLYAYQ